jgi:hypothetical protein
MRHPFCTGQAARITKAANSADGLTVVVAQRWCTRLALHDLSSAVSCCACQTGSRLWWAFVDEHQRCGELDGGRDNGCAWLACSCGAQIAQTAREPPTAPAERSTRN